MAIGLLISPDKTIRERDFSTLDDLQEAVQGYIEPVGLSDGCTMYVNEEFLLGQFGPDDFNSIAGDVCGLGGAPHLMLSGILGPVVIVGPLDDDGDHSTDITDKARRWVQRVAREAGGVMV